MIRPDVHDHPADNGTPLGENPTARTPISPDGRPEPGRRYTVPARQGRAAGPGPMASTSWPTVCRK